MSSPKIDDRWRYRSLALDGVKRECDRQISERKSSERARMTASFYEGQAKAALELERARLEHEAQERAQLEQDDNCEDDWDDSPSPGM